MRENSEGKISYSHLFFIIHQQQNKNILSQSKTAKKTWRNYNKIRLEILKPKPCTRKLRFKCDRTTEAEQIGENYFSFQ